MTRLVAAVVTSAVKAFLVACPLVASAQQGVTPEQIIIGEIAPLSGAAAVGSLGYSAGTKIAVAEANAAGGVNGRKLRLISEDDGYVVARAIQAGRKLLTSDKVFALTSTSGSAASTALLPMLRETGIPAINMLSFPDVFHTPVVPNVFVAGVTSQDSVDQLVRQLADRFPGKKWAAITPDDGFGSLMFEGFERAQKALDLPVVYTATFRRGQKDFSAEILAATNAGVEILFAGGIVSENVAMLKELERLGKKIPVGLNWQGRNSAATHKMIGSAFNNNVYLIDYVVADSSAKGRAFYGLAERYLSADDLKRVNRFSFVGYAAGRLLIEAMRRCGKDLDWACTIREIEATNNFDTGVMGPMSFSPSSHFSKQALTLMRGNSETFEFDPLP